VNLVHRSEGLIKIRLVYLGLIQWLRKSFRPLLAYITFCRPSTIPDFHQYPQIVVKKIANLQLYVTLGGIECKVNKLLVFDSSIPWLMVSGKGGVHEAVKGVVGNFCGATVDRTGGCALQSLFQSHEVRSTPHTAWSSWHSSIRHLDVRRSMYKF
jgi:hypothetical protein